MGVWVIAALAVIGVVLLIAAVVVIVRSRLRTPKQASLSSVWARFRKDLTGSKSRDPVVVVLGERLSGKSTLIAAHLEGSASKALSDARLGCYAGKEILVQEVAGDLLEGREARDALSSLWDRVGLDVALVVCVVRTNAASWTPAGLTRLGASMRDRIDLITAARGTLFGVGPVPVRVCLTHVDERAAGFVEMERVAGAKALSKPDAWSAAGLSKTLTPLLAYVRSAVCKLRPAEVGRVARFAETTGPDLLAELSPLGEAIFNASTGAVAPECQGIVLGGLREKDSERGAYAMLGDALAVDAEAAQRDAGTSKKRRILAAGIAFAIAALLLTAMYAVHFLAVDRATSAVASFGAAVRNVQQKEPEKNWAIDGAAREAEAKAADALQRALDPIYPPLHAAYPSRKASLARDFLDKVRDLYLLPATKSPNAPRRIYALSLLYASRDDALGDQVKSSPDAWAIALDVPTRVVTDYVAWSEKRWQGTAPLPTASAEVSGLERWRRWLDDLDAALHRETIAAKDLSYLQNEGATLAASVGGALELRGLDAVIRELRAVRGAEVDAFITPGGSRQSTPQWVSENWATLYAILGTVQRSSLTVPPAKDKSLREALDDLANVGRAEPATNLEYQVALEGRPTYVFEVDKWSVLLRASRASLYTRAFVDDVLRTGRSPFFATDTHYPAVGLSPSRGATRAIPGIYTAQAVEDHVKPALLVFDGRLRAAVVPTNERALITDVVRTRMAAYATEYQKAIWSYVTSFHLDVSSVAALRSELESMVGPASWLTEFWRIAAENARVNPEGNVYLQTLADALATLGNVDALMTGGKGKYPILDKYYAIVAPLIPALDAGAPAPPGPSGAPLEDRLSKLGKLGLALLDTDKPAALPDVNAWLDSARLLDRSLRTPFLVQIEMAYEYALQNVEKTFEYAYRTEVRPLVATQLARFPIDPRADTDAGPDELLATIGPKGTFRVGIDGLLTPLCKKAQTTACGLRAPVGYRAVKVSSEATELSRWSANLAAVLWDDGGKPKTIPLQARPRSLPEVRRGDNVVATLSFLRSGTTTVYAFNQVPTWQSLPLAWSTSSVAAVGVERVDPSSTEKLVMTTEGEGSLWRFYRLLCKAQRIAESSATWTFEPPVTFDLQPEPWALVVPPGNRGRSCTQTVARK